MKVTTDCSGCSGICCIVKVHPFGLEARCTESKNGRCKIEDRKPASCVLYPFMLVQVGERVVLVVDRNCPNWKVARIDEAMKVLLERRDELIILSVEDVDYFGFMPHMVEVLV